MSFAERLSLATERVEGARKSFEAAQHTLAAARSFGGIHHVDAGERHLRERAEVYADHLQLLAHILTDFAVRS